MALSVVVGTAADERMLHRGEADTMAQLSDENTTRGA